MTVRAPVLWVLVLTALAETQHASAAGPERLNLVFACSAQNDLYRLLAAAGQAYPRLATAAEVVADVAPVPRPPPNFRLASYDAGSRTATLAWEPSPDM